MLKKKFRLNSDSFKYVFTKGHEKIYHYFLVKWVEEKDSSRFGVAVSKRLNVSGVSRNLQRRKIYIAIQEVKNYEKLNKWVVFILLKRITKYNESDVKSEVLNILKQLENEETVNEAN